MEFLNSLWSFRFGSFNQSDITYIFNPELAALYLCANFDNYQKLLDLKSYPAKDLYSLQKAQFSAVASLQAKMLDPSLVQFYLNKLEILNPSKIDVFEIAASFEQASVNLQFSLANLNELAKECLEILPTDLAKSLQERIEQINSKTYQMAFAGCFNSGKSSLINALLETELLGASNAPETAAISLIDNTNSGAFVQFYSKAEFEQILKQAALDEQIAKRLTKYPSTPLEDKQISIEQLKQFNASSSELSALVKLIHLGINSPLLEGGAILIDTPGLDDIIISREQASKAYLAKVDEMFYLMSATQALSQKDCDFLLSFLQANVGVKITLVISKTDLCKQDELENLCDYVKERFGQLLKDNEIEADFELFSANVFDQNALNILKTYIKSRASLIDQNLAKALNNALMQALNTYISDLLSAQQIAKAAQAKNADEIALMNEANDKLNQHLDKLSAKLSALINELEQRDFLSDNEKFLFAKKISSRICDEYSYDANFKLENANNIALRAYEDFLAQISSQNYRFLSQIDQSAKLIEDELNHLLNREAETNFILGAKAALPALCEFSTNANKFNIFEKSEPLQMGQKLNAILCNLDYSNLKHPSAYSALLEHLKQLIKEIAHLKPKNLSVDDNNDEGLKTALEKANNLLNLCKEQR